MYHARSHRERDIVDDGAAQHGTVRKLLEFQKIQSIRVVFVHTGEDCLYILGPGAACQIQSPNERAQPQHADPAHVTLQQ